jgi:hypothetical protein
MSHDERPWSPSARAAFRFGTIYVVAFALLNGNTAGFPLLFLSTNGEAPGWYTGAIDAIARATGHLVGISGDVSAADNGSGDRLGNYLLTLFMLLLAAAGTIAWSLLDRARTEYRRELDWLRILLRYLVASTMLTYGLLKVVPLQFRPPAAGRLVEPYGASSPMGLLWTFMGFSPAYTMFAGWSETTGAMLLFWRRTTTLGALILVPVLANVVMMNFCYDVCVKLTSVHLLAMTCVIAAPQARRLVDLLVRHRPVEAESIAAPPLASRPRTRAVIKYILVAAMVLSPAAEAYRGYFRYGGGAHGLPIDGGYDVTELRRDGEAAPLLVTDAKAWRYLSFVRGWVRVTRMDTSTFLLKVTYDPATRTGTLKPEEGSDSLGLAVNEGNEVQIDGVLDKVRYEAKARPMSETYRLLVHRGFRWVSEEPFNR